MAKRAAQLASAGASAEAASPVAKPAEAIMTLEEIEEKCAALAPEKAEKLRAALVAKRNKQLAEAGKAGE